MKNYLEEAGAESTPNALKKSQDRSRLRRMFIAETFLDDTGQVSLNGKQIRERVANEFGDRVSESQIFFDIRLLKLGRSAVLGEPLPPQRPSYVGNQQWQALLRTWSQRTGQQPPAGATSGNGNGSGNGRHKKTAVVTPPVPLLRRKSDHTQAPPPPPDPLLMLQGIAGAFKDFGTILEDVVRELKTSRNGNGDHGHGHYNPPASPPAGATVMAPVRVLPVETFTPPPSESQKDELLKTYPTRTGAGWRMTYTPHFLRDILALDAPTRELCRKTLMRFADNPSNPSLRRKRMVLRDLEKRYQSTDAKLHYIRATVSYRVFVNVNDKKRIYIFEAWWKRGAIPGFSEK